MPYENIILPTILLVGIPFFIVSRCDFVENRNKSQQKMIYKTTANKIRRQRKYIMPPCVINSFVFISILIKKTKVFHMIRAG